ncbi:CP family cyanate transporter-like MFS transporter [Actinoplanes lutulentus]|uniref:CP family cyanate transporter-like MFS transporter n=1 Tax=Actinoplanes lutulentus TaxID=1287878 RepID=A0A327ZCX7_9ACTN|nr:MFS transporter [Actinoplanes lutulentus]MBB2942557.1 CP family cyanate transporter-like MFS transporter [Actinoplanes lutulentus]RAK38138.1 CP family cyanate transporter-like MFS transporter [Actinoplanes lutulentus]
MALREQQAITRRQGRLFILIALLLAAVNLRLAVTSIGPVLTELRTGLGMSTTVAGLLTSVPVVCFAAIGLAAPRLARRFGAARVIFGGLALLTVGLATRPYAGGVALFLLLSAVALAGIALVNILLPSIVKDRFPDQVGTVTGLYTVALNVGATTAAAATVPLTSSFGDDWRLGLSCWALAAVIALPPWLLLARTAPALSASQDQKPSSVRVTRSPVAWALAVYFGMQSTSAYVIIGWLPQIYRDAGISASKAGILFAVTSFLGVPLGFALSSLAGRTRSQSLIALVLGLFGMAGWGGLLWSPGAAPWLWAIMLGVVNTAFPLVLTMIALRGSNPATVVKLSAFAQSVGYLIAIPGPFVIGALHDATDGWRAPLAVMVALMVPQMIAGYQAGRNRQV